MSAYLIFTTVPSRKVGTRISEEMVRQKRVACVHMAPQGTSIYRWKGKIERSREVNLMMKTSKKALPSALQILKTLHPYELPEILAIRVDQGFQPYMDWILKETV